MKNRALSFPVSPPTSLTPVLSDFRTMCPHASNFLLVHLWKMQPSPFSFLWHPTSQPAKPSFSHTLTYPCPLSSHSSAEKAWLSKAHRPASCQLCTKITAVCTCYPTGRSHELRLQHMELCLAPGRGDVMRTPKVSSWCSEFSQEVLLAFWAPGLTELCKGS